MSSSDEASGIFAKSEELLEILRKGKTFAEELLRENERLRMRVVQLETERQDLTDVEPLEELARLRADNARLRERLDAIDRRFSEMETANHDFARRYEVIEHQNEALANLYVASYQLHSTLEPSHVARAISDIVVGLVGAEEHVVLLRDGDGLSVAVGEGVDARFPSGRVASGEGIEGRVAATGIPYFGSAESGDEQVACVPLMMSDACVGVIGIYKMLSQKNGSFTSIDHELLNLLAGQAATALVSSRLHVIHNGGAA
ncbi:MAG TPA: GAF domain-containing protein [Blastocatellia bacterium]|nr:GAF domain-containing protein [Blastocatellia bacterium]